MSNIATAIITAYELPMPSSTLHLFLLHNGLGLHLLCMIHLNTLVNQLVVACLPLAMEPAIISHSVPTVKALGTTLAMTLPARLTL